MKAFHFYLLSALGFIGLVLSIALVALDQSNVKLQTTLREQQVVIAQNASSQQVLQNLVRDLAASSEREPAIKELLARSGFTVSRAQ